MGEAIIRPFGYTGKDGSTGTNDRACGPWCFVDFWYGVEVCVRIFVVFDRSCKECSFFFWDAVTVGVAIIRGVGNESFDHEGDCVGSSVGLLLCQLAIYSGN